MMNIQDKITFFYAVEEKLWDEKVEANKYFATLCILCVALLGAWNTAGSFLNSALDWNTEISVLSALTLIAHLWVLNIAESVFACKDIKTAVLRSLLIFASFVAGYIAGVVLGVIVIIVVCIILFILGCYFVLGMLSGSLSAPSRGSTRKNDKEFTDNGMVDVAEKDSSGLRMTDVHGHNYAREHDYERWHEV